MGRADARAAWRWSTTPSPTTRWKTCTARGVRALRLDLFLRAALPTAADRAVHRTQRERITALGWHLQFYTPGKVVRDLIPFLADLEADFVIDHMGYMLESDGLTRQDFDRLVRR